MNPADIGWRLRVGLLRGGVILAVGLMAESAVVVFVPEENILWGAWLSSLIALGVIWSYVLFRYRGRFPLQSDILVAGGYSLVNLIPPLYLSLFVGDLPFLDRWGVADVYPLVAFVTLLGMVAFFFGYEVAGRGYRRDVNSSHTVDTVSHGGIILVILVVGTVVWVARGIALLKGVYYTAYQNIEFLGGQWNSITIQLANYGLVLPLMMWLLSGRDPRWRPWALLFTVAEFVWVIPSGSSSSLIKTVLSLLLVVWWRNMRFPRLWFSMLFLLGVVAIPLIREYRYTISSYADPNQVSMGGSISAAIDAKERVDVDSDDRGTIIYSDRFLSRLYDGQFLGYLLKHYRESYGLEWGKTYWDRLPYVFLPYFIFTDRPTMTLAIDEWFPTGAGSAPATFLGEAYINLGYAGIPMMAFIIGVVLAIFDKFTVSSRKPSILVVAVYLFFAGSMPFLIPANGLMDIIAYLRNTILIMILFHVLSLISFKFATPHN